MATEIDPNGNLAPEYINDIPYGIYIALVSRFKTYRGRQLLRPDYGSLVHKTIGRDDVPLLRRSVEQAIDDLPDVSLADITVDESTRNVILSTPGGGLFQFSLRA